MSLRLRTKIAITVALGLLSSTILAAWVVATAAASAEIRSIDGLLTGVASTFKTKGPIRLPSGAQDLNSIAISVISEGESQRQVIGGRVGNRTISIPPLSLERASGLCGAPETLEVAGGSMRVAARCTTKGQNVVVVGMPLADVQSRMMHVRYLALAVATVIALLGYAGTSLMIRRLFKPLSELARGATQMGDGDLDVTLPRFGSRDELAHLSTAISTMAAGLRSKISDLEDGAERMTRLISITSHELRTPLTVIQGYSQLLAGPFREDAVRADEAVERIIVETQRIDRLIQRILDSQGNTRPDQPKQEPVLVSQLLRDSLDLLVIRQPAVTVQAEIEDATIDGDAELLRQLFYNIAQNLERHSGPKASIEVELKIVGSLVRIMVSDDGPGLDQNSLELIEDSLERGMPVPSRIGMGLGLLIMQSAVVAHEGSLRLTNNARGGLTVEIQLPI